LESQLVESINSVGTIKRFGLEEYTNVKTETKFVKLLQQVYKSGINGLFTAKSSELTSRLFTIILLWAGSYFVLQHEITPGELLSFYALIGYLTAPVSSLIGMNKTIQDALIASDRLFELMDLDQEQNENTVRITPNRLGDIRFKDVGFRYGSRVDVFKNFNITFPLGKVSAIVGESGSGKTTIISLLQKIYMIQSGSISIGDYDLKYADNNSVRAIVGVVPQNVDLFAGNVIENIAIGGIQPNMERIINSCIQLGIMDFIESLPNGFNTYLGENGATLSGGQKQRIAIARALYREPEILILDEATSSLDSASEQYVQTAVNLLRQKGKTVIIIAHRLSTIHNADIIFVLEKGQLVEQGSHNQLINNKNKYHGLWQQQFPILQNSTN
jgi:ATP-binding cassette subfamily B protein